MLSLDQLILDHPMYSKDGELSEVWVPGVAPDGPPWGMRPATETPQGKNHGNNEMQQYENVKEYYEDLQKVLINAGLPETEDRSKQPRTGSPLMLRGTGRSGTGHRAMRKIIHETRQDAAAQRKIIRLSRAKVMIILPLNLLEFSYKVMACALYDCTGHNMDTTTICVLGAPSCAMSILLEGARQCPGKILLCLSTSWFCQAPPSTTTTVPLFIKQAVTFDLGGRTYLDTFSPPRHVTYLSWLGGPQLPMGEQWDCPIGGSPQMSHLIDNTLGVRILLDTKKLPLTPALLLSNSYQLGSWGKSTVDAKTTRVIELYQKEGREETIRQEISAFLTSMKMIGHPKVVLKTFWPYPRRSPATSFWSSQDTLQVSDVVVGFFSELPQGQAVLLEGYVMTAPPRRIKPPSPPACIPCVDMLLTCVDYMMSPVILGVTTDLCLESCGIHECMFGSLAAGKSTTLTSASEPLIETMLRRSMAYVMEGKEVLVIGAGGISKKVIWQAAQSYGIKIHLVESDPGHFASSLVTSFIHYDYEDCSCEIEEHAQNILSIVRGKGLCLSGCMAFWDECTILAAILCGMLGLPGPPPNAVRLAKRKTQTQLCLLNMTAPSPPFPYPGAFAVPCFPLGPGTGGVEAAESILSYPLVLKPESGAGAVGVRLVQDAEECRRLVKKMGIKPEASKLIRNDECCDIDADGVYCKEEGCKPGIGGNCEPIFPEVGLSNGVSNVDLTEPIKVAVQTPPPLLAEYITGSEHDVDLVLGFKGRLLAAYVSDNGPTLLPGFTETAAALPSRLCHERRCQLVQAASRSCRALGLYPGVFNVELKMTASGPRLLEINPRMGGFYLRDWICHIYGTDLVLVALALSCGLEPALPDQGAQERAVLVGVMCTGESHEKALGSTANPQKLSELHNAGYIRFNRLEGSPVHVPDQEPYGNVACQGESQKEARERLLGVCSVLGLDTQGYPLRYLTGEFQ